jgi:hypothetical protein
MSLYHSALYLCFSAVSPSSYFLGPPPTASHNAYGKELLLSWHLDTFDLGTYVHHRHFCIVKNYYAEAIAFSHYRVCFVKSRGEKKDGLYMPGVDLRAKVTLLAEGARGSITQVGVGVGSCWEGRGGHVI